MDATSPLPPNLGFVWKPGTGVHLREIALLGNRIQSHKMSDSTVNAHLEGIISDFEG